MSFLTILLIALLLANSAAGYSRAKDAAEIEAAAVDNLFETAAYTKDPYRRRLQRAAVCYARAVAGPDWSTMARGAGGLSPVPGAWTGTGPNGIRRTLQQMGPRHVMFRALYAADQKRGDARRGRLAESRTKLPPATIAFALCCIVGVLVYLTVLAQPRSPLHMTAATFAALTFLVAFALIHSLDEPFTGPLKIRATQMAITADDVTSEFVARYGATRVRCDAMGRPTGSRPS